MRRVATVRGIDAHGSARLRAYRGGRAEPPPADPPGTTTFVPFAGVNRAAGTLGRALEGVEIEEMLAVLEQFVSRSKAVATPAARVLATVMFTDIVDSTGRAAALGDKAWSRTLDRHDEIARGA